MNILLKVTSASFVQGEHARTREDETIGVGSLCDAIMRAAGSAPADLPFAFNQQRLGRRAIDVLYTYERCEIYFLFLVLRLMSCNSTLCTEWPAENSFLSSALCHTI